MLVIRLQRTGRKGHAQFRVVVQDSRRTPTSGKIVAQVGTYDPHTKVVNLDKERAQHYLDHGAQPSDRVIIIFEKEGMKLPKWVIKPGKKESKIRNAEKLRRNQPKEEPKTEEAMETPAEEASTEAPAGTLTEDSAEKPAE